jgi:hypothetical protein
LSPRGKCLKEKFLDEESEKEFKVHPGLGRAGILLRKMTELEQAFKAFESELDLPATAVEIQNGEIGPLFGAQAGEHEEVVGNKQSLLLNSGAVALSAAASFLARESGSLDTFLYGAESQAMAGSFARNQYLPRARFPSLTGTKIEPRSRGLLWKCSRGKSPVFRRTTKLALIFMSSLTAWMTVGSVGEHHLIGRNLQTARGDELDGTVGASRRLSASSSTGTAKKMDSLGWRRSCSPSALPDGTRPFCGFAWL